MFHQPRMALFDLDGTLLDTLADLARSMNEALAEHGMGPVATAEYRLLVGTGAQELARLASRRSMLLAGLPGTEADERSRSLAPAIRETFRDTYATGWDKSTRAYPGVSVALAALHRAGVPLGVLSNKPDPFTKKLTAHFFPDVPFATVEGERNGVPRKPDPAAAGAALQSFGASAGDVAYFGDSGGDMAFARNAGFVPVGVLWGFRSRDELATEGAAVLLDTPKEIPSVFGIQERP